MSSHAPLPRHVHETMTGIEVLRAMIRGELPAATIARTLNFAIVEVGEGFAVFEGTPNGDVLNPHGMVHGGWAATLLDSALGCAVHTALAVGERYTTIEMKTSYVRPITTSTGRVRCEGRLINRGRRLAIAEAKLSDAAGKLLAHGTETCMIFPAGES